MKKTVTANIAGTVFHIEEDAYDQLQRYLAGIRANFSGSAGAKEIMADIESRIAELFAERLQGRNVVTPADVEHVMSVMGQPEDFADSTTEGTSAPPPPFTAPRGSTYKRFFRDPDDQWVGGVLGGLAAYIGMDPLWLRVAMIVLVWASVGVLIPIYILLWILVPKAESAADRLQMRGAAVTVDNIKRTVEDMGARVKTGGQQMANDVEEMGRKWNAPERKGRAAEIIGKLIGVVFIVVAFSMLLSLITGVVGGTFGIWNATWTNEDTSLLDLGELLFSSKDMAMWTGIGVFILLAVPVIGLFLAGFRLLLNTRTPKWLGWSLCILWFVALVPAIRGGMDLGREFKRGNSVRTEIELVQPAAGVLYLDAINPMETDHQNWSVSFDDGDVDVDLEGLHLENGMISGAWAHLDVERSTDSLFHLKVLREAHGNTAKAALDRAQGISYKYTQEGDALLVSPVINYVATDKFRAQDLRFTLEVPLGRSVFLREGSKAVIYDIDNVTNTLDSEMLNRTWTMTDHGLMDQNAPSVKKVEEEELPLPVDTVKAPGPIAAVPYRGPSKRKATANVDATALVLPDLFTLLRPRAY